MKNIPPASPCIHPYSSVLLPKQPFVLKRQEPFKTHTPMQSVMANDFPSQQAQLIRQAAQGSETAFSQVVRHWYPQVYRFAYRYFNDHDTATEVTQRSFIAVHQHLGTLQKPEQFRGWLYRIATNFCHQETRRLKKRRVLPFIFFRKDDPPPESGTESWQESWASTAPGPDQLAEQGRLSELLHKALGQLNPDQRTVVLLKEYEGMKFREIAEALGISENTAKSRLYYGLSALRDLLEKWNINPEEILRHE